MPIKTHEHLKVHAANLKAEGISTCFIALEEFDWTTFNDLQEVAITLLTSADALSKHLRDHSSTAIVVQSPYFEHYPDFFQSIFFELDIKKVFFGYGLPLNVWEQGQTRLPSFEGMTAFTSVIRANHRAARRVHGKKVVFSGDALMHTIAAAFSVQSPSGDVDGSKRILWAPHWTQTWLDRDSKGFSRFSESISPILACLEARPEVEVIFRPHPLLELAIQQPVGTPTFLLSQAISTAGSISESNWRDDFENLKTHPRFIWSRESLFDDLNRTDVLLTEGVAIIGYWGVTGKPMIVWRDVNSPRLSRVGCFITFLHTRVANAHELLMALNTTLDKRDSPWLRNIKATLVRRNFRFVSPNPSMYVLVKHGIIDSPKKILRKRPA